MTRSAGSALALAVVAVVVGAAVWDRPWLVPAAVMASVAAVEWWAGRTWPSEAGPAAPVRIASRAGAAGLGAAVLLALPASAGDAWLARALAGPASAAALVWIVPRLVDATRR